MAYQFICGTVHAEIQSSGTWDRVKDSVGEFCDQMNSRSNEHSYGESTNHDWEASPDYNSDEEKYLENFAEDVAQASRNDNVTTAPGDAWVIMDGHETLGYGKSLNGHYVDLDGDGYRDDKLHVCRALSMGSSATYDPNRLSTSMILHELSHLFDAEHGDGQYGMRDGDVYHVSPMASSYVRARGSEEAPDTCGKGTGTTPSQFNSCTQYTQDNYLDDFYCGGCTSWCRHDWGLNYCTKNEIEYYTPLEG